MIVHRASEFGRCLRASVADRLGYRALPVPDVLEAAYARGREHEDLCLTAMATDGWQLLEVGERPDTWSWDEGQVFIEIPVTEWACITGHLDSVGRTDNGPGRVVEIKAPNAYDRFERAVRTDTYDALTTRYAWQVSAYMVATGLECVVASWDETRGVRTFVIEEPIFSRERIVARVQAIEEIVAGGVLPDACPAVEFDGWSCPWRHLHVQEQPEEDIVLDGMVSYYEYAKRERDTWAVNMETEKQKILAYMQTRDTITTAVSKVTRYTQTTETPQRDRMKADGLWDERYVKTTTSERLRVTLRAKDDDVPTG